MNRPQVYVIGDSISIHYGPYLQSLLDPHFAYDRKGGAGNTELNSYGHDGPNCGDSNATLAFVKRLLDERPDWRPDLLLLNCGLHDVKTSPRTGTRQVPLEQYVANLRQMAQLLKARGVRVAWIRLTPVVDHIHNGRNSEFHRFAADVEAYNAAADAHAAAAGWDLLDLHGLTKACGERAYCDHVHFVEPVRALQAQYLAWQVGNLLA